MAMLAEPRRKQKVINLRAKNSNWSNDANKFGQRMLEKMGWSSGKGLGANENGIVEHIVARYKNDDKGLGFEDKNDQWTKHEDEFNSLLANLSKAEGEKDKLHSGISLEAKSKSSKSRIHYHKFTRGKDLSRYSEKDLANIFGKKSFKIDEKVPETSIEDIKTTEQVFTEKGSMDDYFKNKLAAFKTKNNVSTPNNNEISGEDPDRAFKGFSTFNDDNEPESNAGFGFQSFSFHDKPTENNNDNLNYPKAVQDPIEIVKKTKKKKKKNYVAETETVEYSGDVASLKDEVQENWDCTNITHEIKKIRKTKKNKLIDQDEVLDYVPKKKKSKYKPTLAEDQDNQNHFVEDIYGSKKKKKGKNQSAEKQSEIN